MWWLLLQVLHVSAETVELSTANHDQVLASSQVHPVCPYLLDNNVQVVFVAFCADWCPFSRRLKPIFEESARVFKAESPDASVAWAIVDSVRQADVVDKYLCVLFFYLATYSSRIR